MTSQEDRFRDFEIQCANKCQSLSIEQFKKWLDVEINRDLLQRYAYIKLHYVANSSYLTIYELHDIIDNITDYIYTRYKFEYVNPLSHEHLVNTDVNDDETREPSEYVDDEFENDMINVLGSLHTNNEDETSMEEMYLASLVNDIESALLFQDMMNQISENANTSQRKELHLEIEKENCECEYSEEKECVICYETICLEKFSKLNCGHECCNICLSKTIKSDKRVEPLCAYCREPIQTIYVKKEEYCELFR